MLGKFRFFSVLLLSILSCGLGTAAAHALTYEECIVEGADLDESKLLGCHDVLRSAIWLYAAALNKTTQERDLYNLAYANVSQQLTQASNSLDQCESNQASSNTTTNTIQPTQRFTFPTTTSTGTILDTGGWIENNPQPAINY